MIDESNEAERNMIRTAHKHNLKECPNCHSFVVSLFECALCGKPICVKCMDEHADECAER